MRGPWISVKRLTSSARIDHVGTWNDMVCRFLSRMCGVPAARTELSRADPLRCGPPTLWAVWNPGRWPAADPLGRVGADACRRGVQKIDVSSTSDRALKSRRPFGALRNLDGPEGRDMARSGPSVRAARLRPSACYLFAPPLLGGKLCHCVGNLRRPRAVAMAHSAAGGAPPDSSGAAAAQHDHVGVA